MSEMLTEIYVDGTLVGVPRRYLSGQELRDVINAPGPALVKSWDDLWLENPQPGLCDDRRIDDAAHVALTPGMQFYTAPRVITAG